MWPALIAVCWWPFLTRQGIVIGLIAGLIAVTLTEQIGSQFMPWGRWPKWSELYVYTLIGESTPGRVHVAAWENIAAGRVEWARQHRVAGDRRAVLVLAPIVILVIIIIVFMMITLRRFLDRTWRLFVDDEGNPVAPGGGGYLVLTEPWPSMLRGIWGDDQRFEFLYKFVTEGRVDMSNRAANRDLLDAGVNVVAQLVSPGGVDPRSGSARAASSADPGPQLSLSCNPDVTLDVAREMRRQQAEGRAVAILGGSFDPVHAAHVEIARRARAQHLGWRGVLQGPDRQVAAAIEVDAVGARAGRVVHHASGRRNRNSCGGVNAIFYCPLLHRP